MCYLLGARPVGLAHRSANDLILHRHKKNPYRYTEKPKERGMFALSGLLKGAGSRVRLWDSVVVSMLVGGGNAPQEVK